MALRNIVTEGDPVLTKHCRMVTSFDSRLHELLDDMRETLAMANGVGLAAPQVGVLRRVVLVENAAGEVEELINPVIMETIGEQDGPEGCLSVPGTWGMVKRPMYVRVRAQDRNGNEIELVGEGMTARAYCHETDHLEGTLFTQKTYKLLTDEELEALQNKEDEQEAGETEVEGQ